MVNRLIEILGREAALFESFLQLLEQQQKALVENDADELNRVTELQREKLIESNILNKQREDILENIRANNAITGDMTVTRLLAMVDQNQADQLSLLRKSIFLLNDKILKTRNQNAMLLNKSRHYIQRMMEML
ncbi:MAG: flagellar export chaperone FlgN, partial [bacterium]